MSLTRENYFWHKLHSLSGIIPIGFYMLQHLTLNSFSLAGPEKFNSVIGFFGGIPKHLLLVLEIGLLGIPILFHSIYGLFITSRGLPNLSDKAYRWRENWMYTLQRITGVALFFLLIAHVLTTTVLSKVKGESFIQYDAWHHNLTSYAYIPLFLYLIGIVMASYHLSYGVWNFCIRWGITISDKSQRAVQKFSAVMFVAVTLLGWAAIIGFLRPPSAPSGEPVEVNNGTAVSLPVDGTR